MNNTFNTELEFEKTLINLLTTKGWEKEILKNSTEQQLIENWKNILFENNRGIDRLNEFPLTDGEMHQILDQIATKRTPLLLNGFINGGFVTIKRDNPEDHDHFGKEVDLKIYDRKEIAAGQSRYQIVEQPRFTKKSAILNDRRGDFTLLINGMPVIHVELKKTGVPICQATSQISNYSAEGVFSGLFSLVQIFVAMTPSETLYFTNPGPDGTFNEDYFFHWADFNNEPINNWMDIGSTLLSIPMAHQLIGFYTIADGTDGVLKVLRSYQYYAANAISDKVAKTQWGEKNQKGGFIWHTTGSGKTMTSFKSAQLISTSKDADKVVFLVDRIELGTQSLDEYRNFAGADLNEEQRKDTIQETEDTQVLVGKLTSENPSNTLIVTSIQKMSNISEDNISLKAKDIEIINNKRLVFIIDECHRSTFGEMLQTIKHTFPNAIFFGFTGTPIQNENKKVDNTTTDVFGNELHRYSIADGIRDKNVLGFDPYKVLTFKDIDIRKAVALYKAKAATVEEALSDPKKKKIYIQFTQTKKMAGYWVDKNKNEYKRCFIDENGNNYVESGNKDRIPVEYVTGVEDYIPRVQYETYEHQNIVVQDIAENWTTLSQMSKFHAIFATSSIKEAVEYYRLFKQSAPSLKVTALFDPNIDNNEFGITKEDGLKEIIEDYNKRYEQDFSIPKFAKMKKDIANRLAHKKPYERIEKKPEMQIDLLIVVDQMLTGFDSKWINTLYLDKVLEYESIIQAFSRTNRLYGPDKPFGMIKYYRKPHTMERNINEAVALYSGNKPLGLFALKLPNNLEALNQIFNVIKIIFENAGISDFSRLPDDESERKMFAKQFNSLFEYFEASKVQGFTWKKKIYVFKEINKTVEIEFDEKTYLILVQRYKELSGESGDHFDIPFDLKGYITTIDTGKIDTDYMNSRFDKYLKTLQNPDINKDIDIKKAEDELHSTFSTLTQEEQKFANIFLHDIQTGDVEIEPNKTFREYITEYCSKAQNDKIHNFATTFGLDEEMLRAMCKQKITLKNINEYGRFDKLKNTADISLAKKYFEEKKQKTLPTPRAIMMLDEVLRKFLISGEN